MNRRDFQELSSVRLKEARALHAKGLWDGAYYLAGYAVECALKACIAKGTARFEFPDKKRVDASHTHSLGELIKIAGLDDARADRAKQDVDFGYNWEIVRKWSEQSRYRRHSNEAARDLSDAVTDRRCGIIPWIKPYW